MSKTDHIQRDRKIGPRYARRLVQPRRRKTVRAIVAAELREAAVR